MEEAAVGLTTPPTQKVIIPRRQRWRRVFSAILSFLIALTLVLGILVLGVNKYYTSVWISGDSMLPTLKNLEFGLMNEHAYRLNKISRYQIVIINAARALDASPGDERIIIKRVIGLPNETVHISNGETAQDEDPIMITQNGTTFALSEQAQYIDTTAMPVNPLTNTYIANKEGCGVDYVLGEDEYFVLGDNRGKSTDSRIFGYIKKSEIRGVLFLIEGTYKMVEYTSGGEEPKGKQFYAPWDFRYYY